MGSIELVNLEEKAEQEMAPIMQKAREFAVTDEPSYLAADEIATEIKRRVKVTEQEIGPTKEAATKTWKAAVALWKKYVDDPLEAVKMLDRKRYAWKKAEDKRRQDEADALRKAEEKKAADERLKLAERMEAAGMADQADQVLDAPIASVDVPVPVAVEKPKDQSIMENWTARIVDPEKVPRQFCVPSQAKLNEYARLMKGKAVCDGVVFEDTGKVSRRGL
jgi:hypothetical protein